MRHLPKNYDHKEAEARLQQEWEKSGVYAYDASQSREDTFVIDTPPPTVSGILHMGHIFSYTQADFIARYQRMKGKTVFYPMGFDDNGLPTERLVEKEKKVRGSAMPREDFIALCREVVKSAEEEFRRLFKSTALSIDWKQEYQTISDDVRKLSQMSFLDLLKKGEAYRDFRPTYWDWVDQTAIAQAEIENKEMPGVMNEIIFTLEDAEKPSPASGRGLGDGAIWKTPKELVEKARELRKNGTHVEALLWSCLRDRQLAGCKFRRQHPVEHYVADFACLENKLIIELDGGQHNEGIAQAKDTKRTAFLEERGFKVLRFWNNDVMDNLEGVLESILSALSPHPTPLPQAGEGEQPPHSARALADNEIVIATTRPELLGACVAVMYHPEDPNAGKYKGKYAVTPLFGVKVPMIADELVEREKGTGLVMCCTYGDDTDKEWQRKHELPRRTILGLDGKIAIREIQPVNKNDKVILFIAGSDGKFNRVSQLGKDNCIDFDKTLSIFEQILGLKPKQANTKVIELLQAEGKLLKQTNITHTVKCAERSGTPIEIIPTYQWFIKVVDKKPTLLAKGGECVWYPEFMHIRLNQWIEGLKEDWCISRQRFFGVPFPVWYSKRAGEEGKIIVAEPDQLPIDPLVGLPKGYSKDEVTPSTDVMDTWATSSISPQINAKSLVPNKLFPADLRPQAHEIIRTWAFYTIVKAHLHSNTIPWKNVMISGWCLAADKSKMSKSKGNVITPVDLIVDKGADVVRYWASTSRLGTDTAFSEDLLKIGKKLVTKLWNATSFAAIHLDKLKIRPSTAAEDVRSGKISEVLDKWILTRLHKTIARATLEFERFEYCDARVAIEEFFWKDFCDNYLELVKGRAYGEDDKSISAHLTLYHCLDAILRLFAPIVPHITEELYSHIFHTGSSIHARGNWPDARDYPVDELSEESGIACVNLLEAIRKAKSEKQVSIKFPIRKIVLSSGKSTKDMNLVEHTFFDLKGAGSVEEIEWSDKFPSGEVYTEDKRFTLDITFGEPNQNVATA